MLPQSAYALKPFVIEQNQSRTELGLHLEYLEDKDGKLGLKDVRGKGMHSQWHPNSKATPNFGYTRSAYWLRGTLYQSGSETTSRTLQIAYAVLDDVQLYLVRNGELAETFQTGDGFPFEQRPVWNRNFLFPLEIDAGETVEYYLRIQTTSSVQVPLTLWENQAFGRAEQSAIHTQAIYYGVILVMALFNLFLFFSIRERTYLYYVVYASLTGLFFASLKGSAYQYLWPDSTAWNGISLYLIGPILFACLTLFAIDFLHLKETTPKGFKFSVGVLAANAVGVIAAIILPYSISVPITIFSVLLTVIFCLIAGSILWARGQKPAKYFTLAFAMFLLGTIIFLLNKLGVLPRNGFTENAIILGSALEVTLLSMALGARIQFLKEEKTKAEIDAKHSHIQLIQSEKMAALGHLISSIGHEISNPLGCINLANDINRMALADFRKMFDSLFDDSPEAKEIYTTLNEKLDKVVANISNQEIASNQLLEISKALRSQAREDLEETSFNINEVIRETLVIVSGKLKTLEIVTQLEDLPPVTGHRSQIGQVVTNLLSNAADALEEKRLAIREKGEHFNGKIQVTTSIRHNGEASEVSLIVADNGNGVPKDIQEKIFESFFTTKEAGTGTGLGLSMSADIIHEHHGHLRVTNDTDLGGARFEIRLPANS